MKSCRQGMIAFFLAAGLLALASPALAGPQPKIHSSQTVVSCTPNPVPYGSTATCTATVTDLGGPGPLTAPRGSVGFSSDSNGTFAVSSCVLVAVNASSSSCSVSYTATGYDSGSHLLSGVYGGGSDPNTSTGIVWTGSSGNVALALSTPLLSIGNVSPSTGLRGESGSVTITGSGFVEGATTVDFGSGITLSNLVVVSSTQVTVDLAIGMAAGTGDRDVIVSNPAPGGGSDTLVNGFRVENPVPAISGLSPSAALEGSGGVTVTVNGSGFVSDSVVHFNGATRSTGFVSSSELQVTLLSSDTASSGIFDISVVNPAAGGGSSNAAQFTVSSSGGSFDAAEVGGAVGDAIFLKLAGTSFDLDLLATDVGRTGVNTGFTGTVRVELLDATDNTGSLDSNGCRSSWTVTDTLADASFNGSDNGRITISHSYPGALSVARFRISYPASGSVDRQGCSTDAFTIRPTALVVGSSMNNGSPAGAPALAAGGSFTITASAIAGYDGTPQLDAAALEAHSGAVAIGNVNGSFTAANPASGTASGSFSYSEVGAFRYTAGGVYDNSFSAVDQGSDCTNDFSNVAVGGLYGCSFGNTSTSQWFGRFTPDHFDVSASDACSDAGGFTYSGQPFGSLTITARNAAGATTQNYDYMSGDLVDDNNHSNDVSFAFGGATGSFSPGGVSFIDFAAGVFTSSTVSWSYASAETAYTDVVPRATDSEGVSSAGHVEQGSEVRSGRLNVANLSSITTADAAAAIILQTWQEVSPGSFEWEAHADDSSCTTLAQGDFSLGSYTGNLTAGETSISGFAFNSPDGSVLLAAPGQGNAGSVTLSADLSALQWLRFDDDNDGTPDDASGVISFFDIYETEDGFIHRTEIVGN